MPTPLDAVSDKSQAIYDKLSPAAQQAITNRLAGSNAAQQREIKNVLHFPWHGRSGTTEATRADMRTALTGYLAAGGTVDGARQLKTLMKEMDPAELGQLATKLSGADANPSKALAQHLLPNQTPNPAAKAAALSSVISGLPADASRAYEVEHAGRNHSIVRDAQGGVRIASKEELIQSIKTSCVNAGADPVLVNGMDATLARCRPATLAETANAMQMPGVQMPEKLCGLMDPFSDAPKEDFNAIRPVVECLPSDLNQAHQAVPGGPFVTLKRDAAGAIQIENADVALTGLKIPPANQNLSGNQIADIKQTFDTLAATNYGRAGVPLDLMRHARAEKAADNTSTLADALRTYKPDGAAIADGIGNSDCLCQTEQLVQSLAAQGIVAYPAGVWTSSLPDQRIGANKVSVPDAAEKTGRVTHLDVIVPYTDNNGVEKALVLTPGMGLDPKHFKDIPIEEVGARNKLQARARMAPDGTGVDPTAAQKAALGYLTNIQITNGCPESNGNKQIAGIDLAAGNLYVNTAAGNAYQGPRPAGQGAIFFNFRDAVQNPQDLITLKAPDGQDVEVTKAMALVLMAEQIKEQFGLPPEFVQNVLDLTANAEEYKQTVLWDSVQNLHGMNQAQQVQVAVAPQAPVIPAPPPLPSQGPQAPNQGAQVPHKSLREALEDQKNKLKNVKASDFDQSQTGATIKSSSQKDSISNELADLKQSKLVTQRLN